MSLTKKSKERGGALTSLPQAQPQPLRLNVEKAAEQPRPLFWFKNVLDLVVCL